MTGREATLCRHCGRPITKEATPVKSPYWWHVHSGNVRCDGPSAEQTPPARKATPGACADPSCPVLHADQTNPIHPPSYEPGGPFL